LITAAAVSYLLVVGIKGYAGIISGSLLFIATIVLAIIDLNPFHKEEYHSPLLASLFYVIAGFYFVFSGEYKTLLPFFILLTLAGCVEIFFWIKSKCYKGKTLKQIITDELRLPPLFDLFVLGYLIYRIVRVELNVTPVVVIVMLLLAFDFIRQLKGLKNHTVDPW